MTLLSRKIRVLLLPGPPAGQENIETGVERYLFMLTKAMDGRADYIFCSDPMNPPRGQAAVSDIPSNGKGVARFKLWHLLPKDLRLMGGYVRDTMRLAKILRPYRKHVDVIHVNRVGCETQTIAARLAGFKRIVTTIHNLPGEDEPARNWFRRLVERTSFACGDMHIAVSNSIYDEWHKLMGLSRDKTIVIYNGMILERLEGFDRTEYRKQFIEDENTIFFGVCAQLEARKGIALLVDAFSALAKAHPNTYLLIAGKGPEEENLKKQISDSGMVGRIRLVGYLKDALRFIASLDVNILPSISLEALSYAVIEAMFLGTPSIVSDVGGMKEIIAKSGGGQIVPRNDIAALRDAMRYYIENPASRKVDGEKAKKFAEENLTARQMADKTMKVYERIMTEKR